MSARLIIFIIMFVFASCGRQEPATTRTGDTHISNGLYVPDDLEVQLWAESPMLFNPTNMDVDAKGRIWITEAVNYRNYNNNDSLYLHHNGGDRIVILEDTNTDGKADISKVFVQDADLVSPVGIAVFDSKIVVSCSPNLIVYSDTNRDDKADIKEILLTGFGGKDHDHSLHAVFAGPDGNWYFNVGNAGPHTVKDRSGFTLRSGSMYTGGSPYNLTNEGNRKSDDGRVWVGGLALRVRPDGSGLKVLGHNFRNAYEVFPDSYGNLWQNDNDDQVIACRTTWLMEGGNAGYFSNDGTRSWQADQRPGQDIFHAHWHQEDPGVMPAGDCSGAGAPTGVTFIEGDELGEDYRGMLLSADAGRNIIFAYRPQLSGSGYAMGQRQHLVSSVADSNERYVWNDSTHASQAEKWFRPSDVTVGTDGALYVADWFDPVVGGHQMQDVKGYGRIYRITRRERRMATPKIDLSTTEGQVQAVKSPAINVRYDGLTRLVAGGEKNIEAVTRLLDDRNPYVRARAIWILSQLGPGGAEQTKNLLGHEDVLTRVVAYRALRQTAADILPYAKQMLNDTSPFVRREVIISLRDLPFQNTKHLLLELARSFDGRDRWYLETLGSALEKNSRELYGELKNILNDKDPSRWRAPMSILAWRLHPPEAIDDHAARISDTSVPPGERRRSLDALAFTADRRAAEKMLELTSSSEVAIGEAARYWLAFRQNNDWANYLNWKNIAVNTTYERSLAQMKVHVRMMLDERQSDDERRWHANAMLQDSVGAQMLIGLASQRKIPAFLGSYLSEKLSAHPNASIRAQAPNYFRAANDKGSYDIEQVLKLRGDAAGGRQIFDTKCGTCHRVDGKGSNIGPELSMITHKLGDPQILEAIIDPSRSIVFGYEAWLVNTKENESIFGFVMADTEEQLTIRDLAGNDHVVKKTDIASAKKQPKSVMPSAVQNQLSAQELSDLLAYLHQSSRTAAAGNAQ